MKKFFEDVCSKNLMKFSACSLNNKIFADFQVAIFMLNVHCTVPVWKINF